MKFLKAFIVAFFTVYMVYAFISTEFNINKWKKDDRSGVVDKDRKSVV